MRSTWSDAANELDDRRSRIVYRLEATGPAADRIGPAVSADFDTTIAALDRYAAR